MKAAMAVLPMAFVMVAGPQIVTAILLTTSARPRRDSIFFLLGAAIATAFGTTAAYFLAGFFRKSAPHPSEGAGLDHVIDAVVIALLLFLGARVFLGRKRSAPPRWMSRLETASAAFAGKIGLLLFGLMPSDVVCMATVGASLARHGAAWWHGLWFVGLTVALTAIPLLVLLLLGTRAGAVLPKARDWMTRNSWIVSEVVIVFFLVMTVRSLLGS